MGRQHVFQIKNTSRQAIRVKGVANLKPCCGEVKPIAATVVEPGQAVEVAVTIKIGLSGGEVLHRAAIVTEARDDQVELITTGRAHARVTLDGVDSPRKPLAPGESRQVKYLIRSFGRENDPPPSLRGRTIRCNLPTEWIGPGVGSSGAEAGLMAVERILAVTLPAVHEPGHRLEPLEVLDSDDVAVGRCNVTWEIASALESHPSGLIFLAVAEPVTELKLIVRCRDGRPFRILSATTEVDRLNVATDGGEAFPSHQLVARLQGERGGSSRSGEIVIRTDRSDQPILKTAVFIAGREADVPRGDQENSR